MARKSKSVAKHKIPEIAASLKAKAAIPMTLAIEDTISQLAAPIQAMLDAGYSYADVAAVFKEHGVDLAASSIQSYHRKQLKSDAQVAPERQSLAGEVSPAVAVDKRNEKTQVSVPSSEAIVVRRKIQMGLRAMSVVTSLSTRSILMRLRVLRLWLSYRRRQPHQILSGLKVHRLHPLQLNLNLM